MRKIYDMKEQLLIGEVGADCLDYFYDESRLIEITDRDIDRRGIDRFHTELTFPFISTSIEYKTDLKTQTTGNIFLEIVSVRDNITGTILKAGWAVTCTAQYLYYFTPVFGCDSPVYILDVNVLKKAVAKGTFDQFAINTGDNKKYCSNGRLVPAEALLEISGLCEKVIIPKAVVDIFFPAE